MTDSLRRRCDLAISNKTLLRREFKQFDLFVLAIGADLYAADNLVVDNKRIDRCHRIIKDNTNVFSIYRSFCSHFFAVLLSFENDPQAQLQRTLEMYRKLRRYFSRSYQLSFAAYYLAKLSTRPVHELASSTNAIYKLMKAVLPGETHSKDVVWAVVWVVCRRYSADVVRILTDASLRLDGVLTRSKKRRLLHSIAAFEGDFERIGRRINTISDMLAERKYKYGKHFEQNILAVLAMTDVPEEMLVSDVVETVQYLKKSTAFSRFMSRRELLVHAVIAVINEYTVTDALTVDEPQGSAMKRLNTVLCLAIGATVSEYGTLIHDQVYS